MSKEKKVGKRSSKYSAPITYPTNGNLASFGEFAAAQRDGYKKTEDRIIHEKLSTDCDMFGVFDGNFAFQFFLSSQSHIVICS